MIDFKKNKYFKTVGADLWNNFGLEDSKFVFNDGDGYTAEYLVEKTKDVKPYKLYLTSLELDTNHFSINSINHFISHIVRVSNTNIDYPVIVNYNGCILDGWHRICKAILEGKEWILAKRIPEGLPYNYKKTDDSEEILFD